MSQSEDNQRLLDMTKEIVSAYVGNNPLNSDELPSLIEQVFDRLQALSDPRRRNPHQPELVPAVPIESSVTEHVIYSLEDGQPYKSLKRHLKSRYGMTPEDYRAKWNLPDDYPMVAPSYARQRSELAKKSGLGKG